MGIQDSPPPDLMLPDSKSMLKISWRSLGWRECFRGRMTETSFPPATMRPYKSFSARFLRKILLMAWRWDFRSLRHSSAPRRAVGEPLVKLSASEDNSVSVPSRGFLRSVEGRWTNMFLRVGRVKVERICMYRASSWPRS